MIFWDITMKGYFQNDEVPKNIWLVVEPTPLLLVYSLWKPLYVVDHYEPIVVGL